MPPAPWSTPSGMSTRAGTTAEFARAVVRAGNTAPPVVQTGLITAIVAGHEAAARELAATAHVLDTSVIDRLVELATAKGLDAVSTALASNLLLGVSTWDATPLRPHAYRDGPRDAPLGHERAHPNPRPARGNARPGRCPHPAGPDNPRGFWENRPLVLVNDRILGSAWRQSGGAARPAGRVARASDDARAPRGSG